MTTCCACACGAVWGVSLSPERRRQLFLDIDATPFARTVRADELVIIDVGEARDQVDHAVRDLEAAESLVVRDRGIMGGEPVFKGTRIPVHGIAAMLEAGAAEDEMLAGYPSLDRRALKLARIWAAAHPRRGRQKSLADLGLTLKSSKRVALKPDPLGAAFRKASLVAE